MFEGKKDLSRIFLSLIAHLIYPHSGTRGKKRDSTQFHDI